jgi:hypothetical protein
MTMANESVGSATHLAVAALAFSLSSTAASAGTIQPWPDVLISAPVAKGWIVSGQTIGRIADDAHPSQIETRAQVGHVLSKKFTGWVGWVHFANYVPNAANGRENQLVEQLNWNVAVVGPLHLLTRTRLEQRSIRGIDETSWRWRQQVRVTYALGGKTAPSAILWSEPFLSLNRTTAQSHTLDLLRTFVGVAVPLSHHADLKIGYLNQRIYRFNTTIVNNAIPVSLTVRL